MKTKTQIWNHVYSIVCVICAIFASLPPTVVNVLPTQVQPYIVGIAGVALWLKSNWNLFITPNGAPITGNIDTIKTTVEDVHTEKI